MVMYVLYVKLYICCEDLSFSETYILVYELYSTNMYSKHNQKPSNEIDGKFNGTMI